ncbi:hypothetical protein KAFR_0B04260 [Kazachstania africana CBS 2517]|uniref:Uncharacterized protein n=1 Tax=Kazachstania africana (strain ATCC 22294 / BCRC 22015 / CBS 2517 / CECT 1963 / NBRC 1671 / NRRL Y-8276) TaxID=1071382 RepID=H2AQS2_KAZAF|nr:hypothetical protein KAFR_0B04260 [Kazachstania africana CBS 2517]CCF56722.1 hypothetical protein KAFR_0B04260 [Kazachstania africana CBS 2517]
MSDFPLHQACINNDLHMVQELIENSENIKRDLTEKDIDGRTPLHWATSFQYSEIIQLLLNNMKAIDLDNLKDDAGWTVFHIACSIGNLSIVEALYNRDIKPDLNLATSQGVTPLHLAVAKKYNDVVKFLIDNGASVRIKDKKGQIALHRAAAVGSMKLVETLCQKNSPINWADSNGWTPLFHALAEGHADIAVGLVNQMGADATIEDSNGLKAVDVSVNDNVKQYFLKNI